MTDQRLHRDDELSSEPMSTTLPIVERERTLELARAASRLERSAPTCSPSGAFDPATARVR
jgi:hypothetical protein